MKKKFYTMLVLSCLPAAVLFAGGCRRSELNYQIAESIGTVGKYDNNEPVESPKMREERLAQEAVSEEAVQTRSILDQADALAASYRYDEAIEYLQSVSTEGNSEELTNKINEYQNEQASLSAYDGAIPHLCFPTLIEDTSMAFDGDENSSNYANSMITVREFEAMLESLYEKGYVLVSMSDIAKDVTDSRGVTTLEMQQIMLPADKKPIVLSQDNLNYSGVTNGDGIVEFKNVEAGTYKITETVTAPGFFNNPDTASAIIVIGVGGTIKSIDKIGHDSSAVIGIDPDTER